MKTWIVRHADGALTEHCTNGADPAAEGIDLGVEHARTPRQGRAGETWNWQSGRWVVDPAATEAQLLKSIDIVRARRIGAQGSVGSLAHTRKAEEARAYTSLDDNARTELDEQATERRFPWLTALARARAITIEDAAQEVIDAIEASEARIRTIDAAAVAAKARLRAANTIAGKRAAAHGFLESIHAGAD